MPNRVRVLMVPDADRAELERRARSKGSPARVVERARIGSAIQRLSDDYGQVARRIPGTPIVLGETGWPSAADTPSPGDTPPPGAAIPSP